MTESGLTMKAECHKDSSFVCVHYSAYSKKWSSALIAENGRIWMSGGDTMKESLQALQMESGRRLGGLL